MFVCLFVLGPPSPQNITAAPLAVSQIKVRWVLSGAQLRADWTFVIRHEDVDTSQQRILITANDSLISGLQQYTAVIGGLQSYRKYRIEVFTVTRHGIPSCEQQPVTVRTGEQKAAFICRNASRQTEMHLMTLMVVQLPLPVQEHSDSWSVCEAKH